MTRRTATLVASIVVLVISLGLVTAFPVPFVSFSPGPVKDTLGSTKNKPVIEISNHQTFPTTGQLDLTTVSVTSPDRQLTLPQAMRNWLDPTTTCSRATSSIRRTRARTRSSSRTPPR